jgi:hypothetical protein
MSENERVSPFRDDAPKRFVILCAILMLGGFMISSPRALILIIPPLLGVLVVILAIVAFRNHLVGRKF